MENISLMQDKNVTVNDDVAVTARSWIVKESELLLLNHGEYVTTAG